VSAPCSPKKDPRVSSVVSKERALTKSSVLPSFSSLTAGASVAAATASSFGASSESDPLPEPLDASFLAALAEFFLTGLADSLESESEPEELEDAAFLAFLAGAAFFGASLSEELSDELDSFLATFLEAVFLATTLTDSSEEELSESEEEEAALAFFCGTLALSLVFWALFLLPALTLLPALGLLAAGLASEESESDESEELLSCFLAFFLS